MKQWSPQQTAVFDWFSRGADHLVVRARAGTGKTTTIVEAVKGAPERRVMLCAFNKTIAAELTERVCEHAPRVQAKTLHSLGYDAIRRAWGRCQIDADRGTRLARKVCDGNRAAASVVKRVASLAKGAYPFPESLPAMVDFVLDADIDVGNLEYEYVADRAYAAMQEAAQRDGTCDFDDMVWLPVACGLARPTYDLIVVDEAQDMNASQLLLAQDLAAGRIAVVGDDRQAIYGFRGADASSIDRLKHELKALELGLSITYRCPKSVVALAKRIVPDYEAAPTAPEGIVRSAAELHLLGEVQPRDFVLSRTNAPLVRVCLLLIQRGTRARIQGRDVAAQIKALSLKISNDPDCPIPTFVGLLEQWRLAEMEAAAELEEERANRRRELISDQHETLLVISEGARTLADVHRRIDELFSEVGERDYVTLSTVHKAKGLESERVWILEESFRDSARLEESNLRYVALTRSKSELILVGAMARGARGAA